MRAQAMAWGPSGALRILDQTLLPAEERWVDLETVEALAEAIGSLRVRGAPAIGIAAAMGLVAALRHERRASREAFLDLVDRGVERLGAARPTAVNLFWALERVRRAARETADGAAAAWEAMRAEAQAIWDEDREMCRRIGEAGAELIPDGARVLTHCNTGALATGGIGTALGAVYVANERGKRVHVWVGETRPLLQGSRLTAWELTRAGISATLIADAAAASLMAGGKVDLVLVGADRIARNGDLANKVGTYALAVAARHHGIPFYSAAPTSTVDPDCADGHAIAIEERDPRELTHPFGRRVAPEGVGVLNPAFDVTPAALVDALVTDRGVLRPPYEAALARAANRGGTG